jgi:hypothetical protein
MDEYGFGERRNKGKDKKRNKKRHPYRHGGTKRTEVKSN